MSVNMDFDIAMDPEFGLHRDFRSPSIPEQRRRKTLKKYYSYRAVHPSWVGQSYYTLELVSSTVHTACVNPRKHQHKQPNTHVTYVTEKEEPDLLETLRQDHQWFSFHPLWKTSEVHVAVAQAKAADIESFPIVLPESESEYTEPKDPTDPRNIERVSIEPPTPYPSTMPDNLHLKLRVKTWTKQDNYDNASYFWWGPDRRHHKGKRSYRERHLQKWNEKELGRGTRQRTAHLRQACEELYDYEPFGQYSSSLWYENRKISCYYNLWLYDLYCQDQDAWLERDDDTVYWDWDDENWLGTGWWDDDGKVADEEWGWADRYTQWVDEMEVVYKVTDWREMWCDYEGMAELEAAEVEDDTVSVGSDVIVLEHIVDEDADLDKMSDLAEVLVEGEWDVVSDTSSLSGGVT